MDLAEENCLGWQAGGLLHTPMTVKVLMVVIDPGKGKLPGTCIFENESSSFIQGR